MGFIDEFNRIADEKTTKNGGLAYKTTGNACVDLFAAIGGKRNDVDGALKLYRAARKENPEIADRIVLYTRDIRCGLGERNLGRELLNELVAQDPYKVKTNFDKIAELGRYDDFYTFIGTSIEDDMWKYLKATFKADLDNYVNKKPITLLAKWLKSPNASSPETRRLGKLTARKFGLTEKTYRKGLSSLRGYIDVVEKKMSAKNWDSINFEAVPSLAMNNYRTAFYRNCEDSFSEYLNKVSTGEAKINSSTLYPYNITEKLLYTYTSENEKRVLEAQWNALPNYVDGKNDVVIMADVSGSMDGRPMATSIGLAIYFAQRNKGAYKGVYLSFTDQPHFIRVDETKTLEENIRYVQRAGVGYNTNLDGAMAAIYETSVRAKETPKALVVISDSEIDYFISTRKHDSIVEKWEDKFRDAGLTLPKIIFWNVNGLTPSSTFLAKITNPNVSYCSGQSTTTFKNLTTLIDKTAFEAMCEILMVPRYDFV